MNPIFPETLRSPQHHPRSDKIDTMKDTLDQISATQIIKFMTMGTNNQTSSTSTPDQSSSASSASSMSSTSSASFTSSSSTVNQLPSKAIFTDRQKQLMDVYDLTKENPLFDTKILVTDEANKTTTYYCSSWCLISNSKPLETMLTGGLKESSKEGNRFMINFHDVPSNVVFNALKFMMFGDCSLPQMLKPGKELNTCDDLLTETLKFSEMWEIGGLIELCQDIINKFVRNMNFNQRQPSAKTLCKLMLVMKDHQMQSPDRYYKILGNAMDSIKSQYGVDDEAKQFCCFVATDLIVHHLDGILKFSKIIHENGSNLRDMVVPGFFDTTTRLGVIIDKYLPCIIWRADPTKFDSASKQFVQFVARVLKKCHITCIDHREIMHIANYSPMVKKQILQKQISLTNSSNGDELKNLVEKLMPSMFPGDPDDSDESDDSDGDTSIDTSIDIGSDSDDER
jgi:hypothetical protein